jgi:4-nitrophenyl phosphatase
MSGLLPENIKSLILDMDGVLWKEDVPIGNLPYIFERIQKRGINVAFATNNGTHTPDQYVERLARHGIKVNSWQVVTSALGIANLLAQKFPNGGSVFAIGGAGVMEALHSCGFELLSIEEAKKAQAVVVGIDLQINFEKMREATLLVRRGIPFFATNPDKTFPTPRGEIPGAGAWVSVIVMATGIEPIYAGKPSPYLIDIARKRLGTAKEQTLVVGDRLETDIASGQAAGCPVALVLSGVSRIEQVKIWKPTVSVVAKDLTSLVE